MTGRPIWFGPDERPLFGMLHVPEGSTARAGVVLCSPLGREDLFFHSAYRSLAERLERHGIAALRFDYDGTGDSAGVQRDPGRVAAWSASTQAAVELMRSAGSPVVAAVGMRVGATLAAFDATRAPLDALVLWDPCRSGRTFLREQSALQAVGAGSGDSADGSVQTPGFRYDRDTVADLSGLDLTATSGPMADQILVLVRPDRGREQETRCPIGDRRYRRARDGTGPGRAPQRKRQSERRPRGDDRRHRPVAVDGVGGGPRAVRPHPLRPSRHCRRRRPRRPVPPYRRTPGALRPPRVVRHHDRARRRRGRHDRGVFQHCQFASHRPIAACGWNWLGNGRDSACAPCGSTSVASETVELIPVRPGTSSILSRPPST